MKFLLKTLITSVVLVAGSSIYGIWGLPSLTAGGRWVDNYVTAGSKYELGKDKALIFAEWFLEGLKNPLAGDSSSLGKYAAAKTANEEAAQAARNTTYDATGDMQSGAKCVHRLEAFASLYEATYKYLNGPASLPKPIEIGHGYAKEICAKARESRGKGNAVSPYNK